jgi:hypothetical protein
MPLQNRSLQNRPRSRWRYSLPGISVLLLLGLLFPAGTLRPFENSARGVIIPAQVSTSPSLDQFRPFGRPHAYEALGSSTSLNSPELSANERALFLQELDDFFLNMAPGIINPEMAKPALQMLNRRGDRGKRTILKSLTRPPSELQIRSRMARVDYLIYRLQFDPELRTELASFIAADVDAGWNDEARAIAFAEKAELAGALAYHDWKLASAVIRDLTHPVLQDIAVYEAYSQMISRGTAQPDALALARTINKEFHPQGNRQPL